MVLQNAPEALTVPIQLRPYAANVAPPQSFVPQIKDLDQPYQVCLSCAIHVPLDRPVMRIVNCTCPHSQTPSLARTVIFLVPGFFSLRLSKPFCTDHLSLSVLAGDTRQETGMGDTYRALQGIDLQRQRRQKWACKQHVQRVRWYNKEQHLIVPL